MQQSAALPRKLPALPQKVTTALLLALFCWLNVLAVHPGLHAAAHCDGEHADASAHHEPFHSPEHQCAVTLLAQGQIELVVPPATPAAPTEFSLLSTPACASAWSAADLRLAPGRGPPVLPA